MSSERLQQETKIKFELQKISNYHEIRNFLLENISEINRQVINSIDFLDPSDQISCYTQSVKESLKKLDLNKKKVFIPLFTVKNDLKKTILNSLSSDNSTISEVGYANYLILMAVRLVAEKSKNMAQAIFQISEDDIDFIFSLSLLELSKIRNTKKAIYQTKRLDKQTIDMLNDLFEGKNIDSYQLENRLMLHYLRNNTIKYSRPKIQHFTAPSHNNDDARKKTFQKEELTLTLGDLDVHSHNISGLLRLPPSKSLNLKRGRSISTSKIDTSNLIRLSYANLALSISNYVQLPSPKKFLNQSDDAAERKDSEYVSILIDIYLSFKTIVFLAKATIDYENANRWAKNFNDELGIERLHYALQERDNSSIFKVKCPSCSEKIYVNSSVSRACPYC